MNTLLRIIGWVGLALTVVPSFLFLFDALSMEKLKLAMTIGMVVWFAVAIVRSRLVPASSE
ncbi:hypothetical protein [Pelagicoccus mobilis]|uniref:Uncharacterized protein n=1 Tax=Pelagicoccus mobilis TaxID=415221 RepID=A0A934RY27_9BACT|nr:hypothetical protein [Pelagicoccus mobilis]MBK1876462.1 hypothetical protein [Pelagicoccus mobilis]